MENTKTLGICLDGVIRNQFEQFDKIYRKYFIKNMGLVQMTQNFEFQEDDKDSDESKMLEAKINSLIHLPITTYDLRNHYEFENTNQFESFVNSEHPLEIFGLAGQFPFAMETANKIEQNINELGMSNVILFYQGSSSIITPTYHFLTKNACKLTHVKFLASEQSSTWIWNDCDIIITDSPIILSTKPENKKSIKVEREYNSNSKSDIAITELKNIDFSKLENFIKNNKYE